MGSTEPLGLEGTSWDDLVQPQSHLEQGAQECVSIWVLLVSTHGD